MESTFLGATKLFDFQGRKTVQKRKDADPPSIGYVSKLGPAKSNRNEAFQRKVMVFSV